MKDNKDNRSTLRGGLVPRTCRGRIILILLTYVMVGGALYLNTLDNGFHFDDWYYIVNYRGIAHLGWLPSVSIGMGESGADIAHRTHYRPIVYASYTINHTIGGLDPLGYHMVNLLLHILTSFLVALVLDRLTDRLVVGWLSGLLFLAHPFNAEAVNYVTARSSQLYALFYLLSFYAYMRYRPPLSQIPLNPPLLKGEKGGLQESIGESPRGFLRVGKKAHPFFWLGLAFLSFILSMLSKEMAVTLPVTLFLYEWLMGPSMEGWDRIRRIWIPIGITLTMVVSYVVIRKAMFRGTLIPAMAQDLLGQLAIQSVVLVRTLGLILYPANLTIDHKVEVYKTFLAWPVIGACIVLVGLLGVVFWWGRSNVQKKRIWAFLLVWFFVALSPLMIVRLNAMLQENRVYLAMVGLVGLAAIGLVLLLDWAKRKGTIFLKGVWSGIVVLMLIYIALTVQRNRIWQDDISLWTDALRKNPMSSEAHLALGTVYHQQKNLDLAAKEYQEALILKPEDYRARGNLAQIYRQQGRYDLAIPEYQRVIWLAPRDPEAHYGLGLTYQLSNQLDLAVHEYQTVLVLDPNHEKTLFRLGNIYASSGKTTEASAIFRRLSVVNPDSPFIQATKDRLTR